MEKCIFIQSYPPLKNALYLIDKYGNNEILKIYVYENSSLFRFFNKLNKLFFDSRHLVTRIPSFPKKYPNFINSFLHKNYLHETFKKHFSNIKNSKIFFFSKEFTNHQYYIINRLKADNKLYHLPDPGCDVYNMKDKNPETILQFLSLLNQMFIFGNDMRLGDHGLDGPYAVEILSKCQILFLKKI